MEYQTPEFPCVHVLEDPRKGQPFPLTGLIQYSPFSESLGALWQASGLQVTLASGVIKGSALCSL